MKKKISAWSHFPAGYRLTLLALLGVASTSVWAWAQRGGRDASHELSAQPRAELRVVVTDEVDARILSFVAEQAPALRLRGVRAPSAEAARAALLRGEAELGAFESGASLEAQGGTFQALAATVSLPFGFYLKGSVRLNDVAPMTRVVYAARDEERALALLRQTDLIRFAEDVQPPLSPDKIVRNPRQLELVPVRAGVDAALLRAFEQGALVGWSFQSARDQALAPARHAVVAEDGYAGHAHLFSVLAPRRAELESTAQQLVEAYRAPRVRRFILETFQDSVRRAW